MKIPQCYFNMKLCLVRRKTVWLFISVKLKHANVLTYKQCCISGTERCHLAENAYQYVTNIKRSLLSLKMRSKSSSSSFASNSLDLTMWNKNSLCNKERHCILGLQFLLLIAFVVWYIVLKISKNHYSTIYI